MNNLQTKQAIESALKDFSKKPLAQAATDLFESLGYTSEKRLVLSPNSREQFLSTFAQGKILNDKSSLSDEWKSIDFLFQLTDDEILAAGPQKLLFDSKGSFEGTVIESYLFFAIDLKGTHYTRTALAGITRELNKLFAMPALILFRYGDALTLSIINRRLHKRDQGRDVLEKVTLIKDIAYADPIRGHLEILNDFVLENLDTTYGVSNFVALHNAWQKRLGSYALSNDFYREIVDWYFDAHHQVDGGKIRLPQHCDTEEEKSLFLIRLLTRVIFCWFLVEKRLLPAELFRDHPLKKLLKDVSSESSSYYHAVLQNLFFGTLNMPIEQRGFRKKKKEGERFDQNFGITNLWRYESDFRNSAEWIALAARVPFLNGGLFDCLDDKTGKKSDNFIIDGFSDNPKLTCHLPNDLFFGVERTEDLSRDYGEEDKKTARSKRAKVRGLIEILSRYKFTIEENTPLEEEIALDPELLGKVFENLLASFNEDTHTTARKALGAFYTPREIVSFMVDEALKSYLGTRVPRCKGALEDLFSNKATLKEIKPDTRNALIAAIGNVKILDPACGSGAFPMGALHRLVDLLQKLDPNNESWKRDRLGEARHYRQLLKDSGAGEGEVADCDARIADIERSFDTHFHALDFARKLYLIENSIYGVDIQPIATQIAKLRFFISLIVDQKVDATASNFGVRPLPNLETRIVAADTLIPIEKAQSDLFSGEIDKLRAELAAIRHEHFNARSPAVKRKWRDADASKRQEIGVLLEGEHAIPRDAARKLASWDPYDQNASAPFFDSEWMFGVRIGKTPSKAFTTLSGRFSFVNQLPGQMELMENYEVESGFDVVIGNPPYVRQEQIRHDKLALKERYECFSGTADLYVFFYEAGIKLLRPGGTFSFITSNKWLRAGYGEKLRKWLDKNTRVLQLIDFGDAPVFTAIAYPCIVILHRTETAVRGDSNFRALNWELGPPIESFADVFARQSFTLPQKSLAPDGWRLISSRNQALLERLRSIGTPLGVVAQGRIHNGVKSGLTGAFVVDIETKERLIAADPASEELMKPYFRGRNLRRWAIESEGLWLIYIPWHFPLHNDPKITTASKEAEREFRRRYPAVYAHLLGFKDQLLKRDKKETGIKYEWYAHARPRFEINNDFNTSKVVLGRFMNKPTYAFDEDGYFHNDAQFFIGRAEPFLAGVLNSTCAWWFLSQTCTDLQNGYLQALLANQEPIPIPSASDHQKSTVEILVRVLVDLTKSATACGSSPTVRDPLMLAYFERVLNGLVYELYFPEEVHESGLRLFDVVANAQLPDLVAVAKAERLPRSRKFFEDIHDGDHPIRISLDKLQTLDTVRIIEGKS